MQAKRFLCPALSRHDNSTNIPKYRKNTTRLLLFTFVRPKIIFSSIYFKNVYLCFTLIVFCNLLKYHQRYRIIIYPNISLFFKYCLIKLLSQL